jgi:hypothetical protein
MAQSIEKQIGALAAIEAEGHFVGIGRTRKLLAGIKRDLRKAMHASRSADKPKKK